MQRDLLLCWHECTWPPTQKLSWQLAWWHYICSLICQQMEKEDCNFPALERKRGSESNIQRMWDLEGLACPPPSALERGSEQSRHCSHAKRLAAVLAWMHMTSNSKAWLAACLVTLHLLLIFCHQIDKKTTTSWHLNGNAGVRATFNRTWDPEGLACPPPNAWKRWSGQSWHCSHAKRLAAVLAWMHMASNLKA